MNEQVPITLTAILQSFANKIMDFRKTEILDNKLILTMLIEVGKGLKEPTTIEISIDKDEGVINIVSKDVHGMELKSESVSNIHQVHDTISEFIHDDDQAIPG